MRSLMPISLLTVALILSSASPANAVGYRFSAQTFMRGHVLPAGEDTSRHLPLYQLLNLETRDMGVSGLSLSASLWGAAHILDIPLQDRRVGGDVNTLYIAYRPGEKSLLRGMELRIGRQFVSAGPTVYEQLDGLYARYSSTFGVDLTIFGGMPTGARFTRQAWPTANDDYKHGGNWVFGGRLGYRLLDWANVGASYRHKLYDGELAFHEVGWDAAIHPFRYFTLLGDGTFELTAGRLKAGRAMVRADISRKISAFAGYRFSEPDLFIPRTSIFAVFSDIKHQELFVEGYYAPKRWLSLNGEVGSRFYGKTCNNDGTCDESDGRIHGLLRADVRLGADRQYRISVLGEYLGAPDGGYTRGRIGTYSQIWQKLSAVVEADVLYLQKRESSDIFVGVSDPSQLGLTGAVFLTYALTEKVQVLAGGRASSGPILKNQGSFLVRLIWEMDGATAAAGPVKVSRSSSPTLAYLPGGAL